MLSPWPNSSLSTYIPQFPMLVSLMCTQYAFRSCQEFRVMFLTISVFLSPPFRPSCWREGRSLIFRNFSIFHVACVQKPETVRISSFTSHMFADFTASVRSLLLALFAPILFNCFRPIPVWLLFAASLKLIRRKLGKRDVRTMLQWTFDLCDSHSFQSSKCSKAISERVLGRKGWWNMRAEKRWGCQKSIQRIYWRTNAFAEYVDLHSPNNFPNCLVLIGFWNLSDTDHYPCGWLSWRFRLRRK